MLFNYLSLVHNAVLSVTLLAQTHKYTHTHTHTPTHTNTVCCSTVKYIVKLLYICSLHHAAFMIAVDYLRVFNSKMSEFLSRHMSHQTFVELMCQSVTE
jgi:hypothetical protein